MDNKSELLKLQAMKRVKNYHSTLDQTEEDHDDFINFKIKNGIKAEMVDDSFDFDNAPIASLFDRVA